MNFLLSAIRRVFTALVISAVMVSPSAVGAPTITSTRVGDSAWGCYDKQGHRLSGHERQDKAQESCTNHALANPGQPFFVRADGDGFRIVGYVDSSEPQPEPEPEPEPGPDPDPQWTHCAGEGQWCEFEGTHEVRFGAENAWIVIVRTGGVECSIEEFGGEDPIWGVSKTCELGAAVEAEPEPQPEDPQQPQQWPQPPMAGMPVVNAPEFVRMNNGWNTARLWQQSPESISSAEDGVGAFRTTCLPSHMAFDDPLLFPGVANRGRSHHHIFFGHTGVRAETDLSNLRGEAGGSTCSGGTINKSAYWVPTIIDTRDGSVVVPRDMGVYYKSGYGLSNTYRDQIVTFPAGLRLLAGEAMASSVPQRPRYQYFCENGGPSGHFRTIPNCPVGSEMWIQLEFPECWDGINLDSPDHKSHMAYAGDNGGRCPSTHPVPITTITFNVIYPIRAGMQPSAWRLSSDMNPNARGVSMHGDWINGWDPEFHAIWLSRCTKAPMDCHTDNLGDGRRLRQD